MYSLGSGLFVKASLMVAHTLLLLYGPVEHVLYHMLLPENHSERLFFFH